MNVNDVLGRDTEPLFFFDCVACDKLSEDTVATAVTALSMGCKIISSCLLDKSLPARPG
ncbi:hypothetical protein [Hydrogenophaga atypica]|uniref:Uncharacterized protein n=1 Tax=Hydrogenophaga atypica TaxID=249409 RepID=A0ABW2QMG4_9BURK